MKSVVEKLAADFRHWGKPRTRRVQRGVKKWGVVFNKWTSVDRKRG